MQFSNYDFIDSKSFAGKIILTSFPGLNSNGLFEEKILNLIKSKSKLTKKNVTLKEAEEIIKKFNKKFASPKKEDLKKNHTKSKDKKKK